MKRLIAILFFVLLVPLFAQESEVKTVPLEKFEEVAKRNAVIENAFIGTYLKAVNKEIAPALMDLYLHTQAMDKLVQDFVKDLNNAKTFKEFQEVMLKYNLKEK